MRSKPLFAVCAVAAVLAGCGGSNDAANNYVKQVNAAQQKFATAAQKLSAGNVTSISAVRSLLGGFHGAVLGIVNDLRSIKPPSKVAALHQTLIADLQRYGDELGSIDKGLGSHNARALSASQQALVTDTTTVTSGVSGTIEQINKKLHS